MTLRPVAEWLRRMFGRPGWHVERARPAHAEAIAALHGASFARGWSAADIDALLADPTVLADVLRPGAGAMCGFALSRLVADEAEILSIAVASRRRAGGGGRTLLSRHLGRLAAAGARRVVLEVDEANSAALALYRRFGFERCGSRPAYYARADGGRGNALLLSRSLG